MASIPVESGDVLGPVMDRMLEALRSHDAGRFAALFADDYVSIQPAHPARGFGGSAQVLANWTAVFEGVPDFHAELLASAVSENVTWGEWAWTGHHTDGSPFAMSGVTILEIRDGLIARGRLYMETVDAGDQDIDQAVRELYRPPGASEG
jgi:ketosteroid isomerase-like protein